mgnify:CR=1 FL=1
MGVGEQLGVVELVAECCEIRRRSAPSPVVDGTDLDVVVDRCDLPEEQGVIELRLQRGGQLWIVANRHLNYPQTVQRIFNNHRIIYSNSKFVVIVAIKR